MIPLDERSLEISSDTLCRRFGRRTVFENVSFSLRNGSTLGITGKNGSGKTTLLKILAGALLPTSGSVNVKLAGATLAPERLNDYLGYVAPYLAVYEEFTPLEHLRASAKMRGSRFDEKAALVLLERLRLGGRSRDDIRGFSSGMKQRVKYALALAHEPPILMFDEPMTNLDAEGVATVEEIVRERKSSGGVVILATNDERDKALCDDIVSVGKS